MNISTISRKKDIYCGKMMIYFQSYNSTTTMITELLVIEPSLGDIILKNSDVKTTVAINNTCKTLNAMTKEDVHIHYIDYTIMEIPWKFEELAKNMMFFNCTEEEYKAALLELSKRITDEIKNDVIDIFVYNYHWYKNESFIACDIYKSIAIQYKDFIASMDIIISINEEDENDDFDW